MDFIDDKVYNENDISEIGKGKSSDQENMNDDFFDTKTRSEDYNSKSVNNDVQSEEIQSRTTDFHKNNKRLLTTNFTASQPFKFFGGSNSQRTSFILVGTYRL